MSILRAQIVYWVNVGAIVMLLLVPTFEIRLAAGVIVLSGSLSVLRALRRTFEHNGALAAMRHFCDLAVNDREAHQDD